jgi:putative phage-type endonuclease
MIIHDVEQGSPEWHALRAGIPTASEASKLVTSTGKPSTSVEGYAMKLAGDLYAGHDIDAWEGNAFTARGHELEHEARLAYELENDADVEQVGFITNDEMTYGASPDGLCGEGLVEIKCLPKKHIAALVYFNKHGKAPPDYIAQIQFQLMVTGRVYCDLLYYHPDLPSLTIRVYPDDKLVKVLLEQLEKCLEIRDNTLEILETM